MARPGQGALIAAQMDRVLAAFESRTAVPVQATAGNQRSAAQNDGEECLR